MAKAEDPFKALPEKKFRHRPEPLFIPPPPSYTPHPAASHSGATLYQSQLRSPRVLGDHLLLDPGHELPPYTPPPMLSPVRQGSGLFSNVLLPGHGPGGHAQLPLTPLTPTPRVLLCRSSESAPRPPTAGSRPGRAAFLQSSMPQTPQTLVASLYSRHCGCRKHLEGERSPQYLSSRESPAHTAVGCTGSWG